MWRDIGGDSTTHAPARTHQKAACSCNHTNRSLSWGLKLVMKCFRSYYMCTCVNVCVCMCVSVYVCMCVCMCVEVRKGAVVGWTQSHTQSLPTHRLWYLSEHVVFSRWLTYVARNILQNIHTHDSLTSDIALSIVNSKLVLGASLVLNSV